MELKSIYEQIGGEATIRAVVNAFYPKVYENALLSPLFEGDIAEIKRKQWMFLTQLTGGGALYSEEFGPPNMRMRHMQFAITEEHARVWLQLMKKTFDEVGLSGTEAGDALYARLCQIAPIMVNTMVSEQA